MSHSLLVMMICKKFLRNSSISQFTCLLFTKKQWIILIEFPLILMITLDIQCFISCYTSIIQLFSLKKKRNLTVYVHAHQSFTSMYLWKRKNGNTWMVQHDSIVWTISKCTIIFHAQLYNITPMYNKFSGEFISTCKTKKLEIIRRKYTDH